MNEPKVSTSGQIAILVSLVLLFILVIAVAPSLKKPPIASTDKRLRAKAGTERQGVRALVSSTAHTSTDSQSDGGTRDKPLEAWSAPKNWERLREMEDVGLASGSEEWQALNGLAPAEGLAAIQAQLAAPQSLGAIARLYAAMGKLYTYQNPPEPVLAAEAFDRAMKSAATPEDRHEITQSRILALADETSPEETLALIDVAIQPEDDASLSVMELEILRGNAYEKLEQPEQAIRAYRHVLETISALMETNDTRAESVCRQAAMRLAGLYRATGRDDDARDVVRQLHKLVEGHGAAESVSVQ